MTELDLKKQSQFSKAQMNVNSIRTKDYGNCCVSRARENKANQSQFRDSSKVWIWPGGLFTIRMKRKMVVLWRQLGINKEPRVAHWSLVASNFFWYKRLSKINTQVNISGDSGYDGSGSSNWPGWSVG
jgi:hypothetical protein